MRLPEQVTRLGIVIGAIIAVAALARFVVIPSTFFSTSLHRSSTIEREVAKPIRFAGSTICGGCHEEQHDKKLAGYHKNLGCETCHGPSAAHLEDPSENKPYAPRDRKFCPVCHAYDSARPTGFPQINPTAHNPLKACINCHDPHDPVPPEVPHECSACHAQIANTKAVSSHALIECTTCHEASNQHMISPRAALPSKPQSRDFCGGCHAQASSNPDAPKVDMSEHHEAYLCWQCHYPHLPEGAK